MANLNDPGDPLFDRSSFESAQKHIVALEAAIAGMKKTLNSADVKPEVIRSYNRLIKTLKKTRMEAPALGKAMEVLATKFQGSSGLSGAFTRFAGAAAKTIGKTDETTGAFKLLGKTTTMTAGKFGAYVATLQVAIGVTTTLLDHIDKARIKQAGLVKSFGAIGNISIDAPFRAAAMGIEVAGTAGEKAAERLFNSVARMRSGANGGKLPIGPEGTSADSAGQDSFRGLAKLTAGALGNVPELLTSLREVFAMKPGDEMRKEIEKIGHIAYESQVPMEQFTDTVFSMAQEFVNIGVRTQDTTAILGKYADAVGKTELPMQMVVDYARKTMGALHTAGGVEELFMAGHFAAQGWEGLDKDVQTALNAAARAVTGDKKDFRQLGPGQKSAAFEHMKDAGYAGARGDIFVKLINSLESQMGGKYGMGRVVAKQFAKAYTGQELDAFRATVAGGKAGGTAADVTKDYTDLRAAEASGNFRERTRLEGKLHGAEGVLGSDAEFKTFVNVTAAMQKKWTDVFEAPFKRWTGTFIEMMAQITGRSADAVEASAITAVYQAEIVKLIAQHPGLGGQGASTWQAAGYGNVFEKATSVKREQLRDMVSAQRRERLPVPKDEDGEISTMLTIQGPNGPVHLKVHLNFHGEMGEAEEQQKSLGAEGNK